MFTIYGCYVQFQFKLVILYSALIYFREIYETLPKNDPPKRIKILKQKMSRPTTDTPLSLFNLLFSLYAYRVAE